MRVQQFYMGVEKTKYFTGDYILEQNVEHQVSATLLSSRGSRQLHRRASSLNTSVQSAACLPYLVRTIKTMPVSFCFVCMGIVAVSM